MNSKWFWKAMAGIYTIVFAGLGMYHYFKGDSVRPYIIGCIISAIIFLLYHNKILGED